MIPGSRLRIIPGLPANPSLETFEVDNVTIPLAPSPDLHLPVDGARDPSSNSRQPGPGRVTVEEVEDEDAGGIPKHLWRGDAHAARRASYQTTQLQPHLHRSARRTNHYLTDARAPCQPDSSSTSRTTRASLRLQAEQEQERATWRIAVQELFSDDEFFDDVPSPLATHNRLHDLLSDSDSESEIRSILLRNLPFPAPSRPVSPDLSYLNTSLDQWSQLPLTHPNPNLPTSPPVLTDLQQHPTMAQPFRMPFRGASGAPSFSPTTDARSIIGFFEDLDYIFDQAAPLTDKEKKTHTVRYAPDSEKTTWRALEEFTDDTRTYEEFQAAVKKEYVGDNSTGLYSLRDLDLHVSTTARGTLDSTADFNIYSRQFRAIATVLVAGRQLRTEDRDHLFINGLPPTMRTSVLDRLRITETAVRYPRDAYTIAQVTAAAHHVLEASVISLGATASPTAPVPAATPVKSEVAQLVETLNMFFSQQRMSTAQPAAPVALVRDRPPHLPAAVPQSAGCFYCDDAGHGIRTCPHVDADIAAGFMTRRAVDGKLVLPNGSFVPRTTPGNTMRERFQNYHQAYPDARSTVVNTAPQMLLDILHSAVAAVSTASTYSTAAAAPQLPTPAPTHDLDLDLEDQIESHRQEILALERRRAQHSAPSTSSRSERAGRRLVRFNDDAPPAPRPLTPAPRIPEGLLPQPSARIEEVPDEDAPVRRAPDEPTRAIARPLPPLPGPAQGVPVTAPAADTDDEYSQPPSTSDKSATTHLPVREHPFSDVRDATYAPPTQRNFGAPPPRPAVSAAPKPSPAFSTRPPVYDPQHLKNVAKRNLSAQNKLISEVELLSMSPDYCAYVRNLVTPKRTPNTTALTQDVDRTTQPSPHDMRTSRSSALANNMPAAFAAAAQASPPVDALVAQDPVEAYLKSLPPGAPRDVFEAVESTSIHALDAVFLNKTRVSCILDSGCSVLAMSEAVCHHLGLAYDPKIILRMQSANGEFNYSLGLARNVPVQVGTLSLYLPFHIIASPAYDVLLGRPFSVCAASIVRTRIDGSQTITLTDPYSGANTTIPTAPRRPPEFKMGVEDLVHDQGDIALIAGPHPDSPTPAIKAYPNLGDNISLFDLDLLLYLSGCDPDFPRTDTLRNPSVPYTLYYPDSPHSSILAFSIHSHAPSPSAPCPVSISSLPSTSSISSSVPAPAVVSAKKNIARLPFDMRQALFKAVDRDQSRWPQYHHHILWADHNTVHRCLDCSAHSAVTGSHPARPLDLAEATFLELPPDGLINTRARTLAHRREDIVRTHANVYAARILAAKKLKRELASTIHHFDSTRGTLVLVRDVASEKSLNKRTRPRYLGPYAVLLRNRRAATSLGDDDELDPTESITPDHVEDDEDAL
ncbi:uncharacterized protein BXZ73DRAFT_106823 [Epithele typhae]|uniref:uncharacterized protein n=1 Tax=Epithele typhae TaxID=378194 RepID=UPI002008EB95|nr:uncharacterized protein BXZ73DRAFT_106823 [Epithele typhae]KAH9913803.1 hypothetical protein BXZ73DRAFT_106823 [Epithele typhae]